MFTNPEQFAAATKSIFEFQVMTFNVLTSKTIESVEQLIALNMAAGKKSMEGMQATSKQMTQAKDPQAMMEIAKAELEPNMSDVMAYNAELNDIISNIKSEFTIAADAHLTEAKSNLTALIQDVTKNVPPGSENAVEIIKTAIGNAFNGFEQVTQSTKQAVATVEEEIAKATSQISQNVVAKKTKKAKA